MRFDLQGRQGRKTAAAADDDTLADPRVLPGSRRASDRWRDRVLCALLQPLLRRVIRTGSLTLVSPLGRRFTIGGGGPHVRVRIHTISTLRRLLSDPDLAIGEAYMDGTLTVDGDVYAFIELCLSNLGWRNATGPARLRAFARRALRRFAQHNPLRVARANVAHHYDLSDALYELFLDPDRQYSCAYYVSSGDSLERAQEQKQRHLAAKLLLKPDMRVLDIGSGWGGLARYLAKTANVDVTGVTLSREQHAYATKAVSEAGEDRRIQFKLQDYREEFARYDRIVSVGMFEHVGVGHYQEFFDQVSRLLVDDGVALIHTIGRADGPGAAHPWINKYIFPGGYVPALSEILPAIERAGLYVTDIEVLRLHYAETLRAWRTRFTSHRAKVAGTYDERFYRMWEFYLAGCEAAFRHGGLVNFQIQLAKRVDAAPMTRDYISAWETAHPLAPQS